MLQALRLVAVLLLLVATAAGAAEIKPFAREDMASDAVRLTEALRIATAAIGAEVKGETPGQLLKQAGAEQLDPVQPTPVGRKTRFRHRDGLVVEYVDHTSPGAS